MTRQEEGGNNRVKKGKGQKWNKNRGPVGMDNGVACVCRGVGGQGRATEENWDNCS